MQNKKKNINVPKFDKENGFDTTLERSKLMKKVKKSSTKPEILLRKELWILGYRYRINYDKLPGKPDIVFPKHKIAIFVDGDFWHGYNWEYEKRKIKRNRNYWIPKIERNIQRDIETNKKLENEGWKVIRFWEHQIKKEFKYCIEKIIKNINKV